MRGPDAAGRPVRGLAEGELGAVIEQLELSDLQKRCLRARWLDAVVWLEGKAKQAQRLYYALRLLIIGGVIILALVSLDLGSDRAGDMVRWATSASASSSRSAPRSRDSSVMASAGGTTECSSSA